VTLPFLTPFRLAIAGLCLVLAWLLWPRQAPDTTVEDNGYRVAKRLPTLRRQNAEALRALEAARAATDAQYRKTVTHIQRQAESVMRFEGLARVDTATDVRLSHIKGAVKVYADGDTLIPLRVVREHVTGLLDTVMQDVANLHAAVMIERGRASLANQNLQATIAAQDTVIQGLRSLVKRTNKPWYKRAIRGVEDAAAGVICGSLGYVVGGPLPAVGFGVACAAISGVRR